MLVSPFEMRKAFLGQEGFSTFLKQTSRQEDGIIVTCGFSERSVQPIKADQLMLLGGSCKHPPSNAAALLSLLQNIGETLTTTAKLEC
jgi:hypothetical protein